MAGGLLTRPNEGEKMALCKTPKVKMELRRGPSEDDVAQGWEDADTSGNEDIGKRGKGFRRQQFMMRPLPPKKS